MNGTYDSWKTSPPSGEEDNNCPGPALCNGCPECLGDPEECPATLPTGVEPGTWAAVNAKYFMEAEDW